MQKYIHYGADSFNPEKFEPIVNSFRFSKPNGGFWASRIDAKYGWRDWCEDNEFNLDRLDRSFTFTLKEGSRVYEIRSVADAFKLPFNSPSKFFAYIDFEKCLEEGIDAIEVTDIDFVYETLYGWDCDSILILNPEIIVV